jgi:prepilin-type N-terminal cleavage/methylation domain-containing protein
VACRRRGFTLTEILITLALLSIMLVIVYGVMTSMFRSGTVTQWESVLTTDFTNADSRIRDFLNASSYPSLLTPQGNAVLNFNPDGGSNNQAFLLGFPAASGNPPTATFSDVTAKTTLLKWYRCEDGRSGIEGLANQPPKASQISLVARPTGRTRTRNIVIFELVMEEAPVSNLPATFDAFVGFSSPAAGQPTTTRMVSDVREIVLKLFSRNSGALTLPTKDRVQVEVEIKCVEPALGQAERSRKITAEANVGAKGLTP